MQDITPDQLVKDDMRREAVLFNLQIIGEAAKKLPDDFKANYPNVEWRKISGLRDIITHADFSINMQIISDIIDTKLPALRDQVAVIIEEDSLADPE